MDETRIQARKVGLGVRPPRLALFFPLSASYEEVNHMLASMTAAWGGWVWLLVPTDGEVIQPIFRDLLRQYDPDQLGRTPTLSASAPVWESVLNDTCTFGGDQRHPLPIWPANIPWPLTGFEHLLTDTEVGVPGYSEGFAVHDPNISSDPLTTLLISSWTGTLVDETRTLLKDRGVAVIPAVRNQLEPVSLMSLLDGSWYPSGELQTDPAGMSLRFIGGFVRPEDWRAPPVIVCGDTISDFAFFWNLRVLRGQPLSPLVSWVPRTKLGEDTLVERGLGYLATHLNHYYRRRAADRVLITSHSMSEELYMGVLGIFKDAFTLGDWEQPTAIPTAADDLTALIPSDVNYWDLQNPPGVNSTLAQFLNGEGMVLLNTPRPGKISTRLLGGEVRWVVDVTIEGMLTPRRPQLGPVLLKDTGFSEARPSKLGATYEAISPVIFAGASLESIIVRPRPDLPNTEEVLKNISQEANLTISASDKGRFETEACDLFGDLATFARHLSNPGTASVLLRFIDQSPNVPGLDSGGVPLKASAGRVLRLIDLDDVVGMAPEVLGILDFYLQRGILHRGFFVKCTKCRYADWYPIDSVGDKFGCDRCREKQSYHSDADVYFRLDEMVRQALVNNSHISILALNCLRLRSKLSFLSGTALELIEADGKMREVDFAAIVDGDLWLGESKTNTTFTTTEKNN